MFYQQGSLASLIFRTFTKNKLAVIGAVIVVGMVLFCFVGPLFYHTNQVVTNIIESNDRPSGSHVLGTDNNGYDILGRLMAGGQISIEIGLAVAVIATFLGVVWGAISGYFGKAVDAVMMRVVDIFLAIPVVFLFIFVSTILPTNTTPLEYRLLLIAVLAGLSWLAPARLVRGETLDAADPRVRGRREGDGGQVPPCRFPPHNPQCRRHDYRQCHFPGGRRHIGPGRAAVPWFRPPAAHSYLGRDALAGQYLPLGRLLVGGLPGPLGDHPYRGGVQLHR